MISVNPFKYGDALAIDDMTVDGDTVSGLVQIKEVRKPVAIALFADDVPIYFARAIKSTGHSLAAGGGRVVGQFTLRGLRTAYGIADTISLKCGRSGKRLYQFPKSYHETIISPPEIRYVSVSELVQELDTTRVNCLDEIMPAVIEFYRRHGRRRFIEAVYLMFLKRMPESHICEEKLFDETELSNSLLSYMREVCESDEARRQVLGGIPGPTSEAFTFNVE